MGEQAALLWHRFAAPTPRCVVELVPPAPAHNPVLTTPLRLYLLGSFRVLLFGSQDPFQN